MIRVPIRIRSSQYGATRQCDNCLGANTQRQPTSFNLFGGLVAFIVAAVLPAPSALGGAIGDAGRARICLTDEEVKLRAHETIVIPATSVFEDQGPNEGARDDSNTWRHETGAGEIYRAAFQTVAPVDLTATAKCAEVGVKMSIGPLRTARTAHAADAHLFRLSDVFDYPVPNKKPPIEIGKLIDDMSVAAVLLTDVNNHIDEPQPPPEQARAALCLVGAQKLAALIGAGVGGHSTTNVELGGTTAHSASYTCPSYVLRDSAGFYVSWDGRAKPAPAARMLIAKAGALLTGATQAEILAETTVCLALALKPENNEMASREFRGVKIECTAFARDGGAGSLDIYRRFGVAPVLPDPSAEARSKVDAESRVFDLEEAKKAAAARRFANWYEDGSIPKDVKVFAMMASRITALDNRCPSAKSHAPLVAAWASSSGISSEDLRPGGRYFELIVMMMSTMQKDVARTSVKDACAAAAKYDQVQ